MPPTVSNESDSHERVSRRTMDHEEDVFDNGSVDLDANDTAPEFENQSLPTRKSNRVRQPPIKLRDYVCDISNSSHIKYPLSVFVNYTGCSFSYQKHAMTLLTDVEPQTYTQASKDPEWTKAMEKDLEALEVNNT